MVDKHLQHPRRTDEHLKKYQSDEDDHWLSVGRHTYGFPEIEEIQERGNARLTIGKYCSIADQVTIFLANHNPQLITQYPFRALKFIWEGAEALPKGDHVSKDVYIGNDIWIGYGVKIMPGARIGDGAIITAGAVVTGEVPPYSIYGGVPAKLIRKKYSDDRIEKLLKISWWNWDDEKVNENCKYLLSENIDDFINQFYDDKNGS